MDFDLPHSPGCRLRGKVIHQCFAAIAAAALALSCPLVRADTTAAGITTPQIMAETITALPSCLNYQVTGVCFFLSWCFLSPCIQTSIKVQHYMPDDIVSTYSEPDQHPWLDVGKLYSAMLKSPGDAILGGTSDAHADTWPQSPTRESIVLFKNASAIGNPVTAIIGGNTSYGVPNFTELMNFFSTGISQIGQMWAQVPSNLMNSTVANFNSMVNDAKNLAGQYRRLGNAL
jgi:hypothetical protein